MNKEIKKPTVASGDDRFLDSEASQEDLKKGDYTKVITLSYDEVDASYSKRDSRQKDD